VGFEAIWAPGEADLGKLTTFLKKTEQECRDYEAKCIADADREWAAKAKRRGKQIARKSTGGKAPTQNARFEGTAQTAFAVANSWAEIMMG
jgi:hypothetical protein